MNTQQNPVTELGGKFLTFTLGAEGYGIRIQKVREIIGIMDITAIPRMPPEAKGVINLRGQVITVLDLRTKFGMAESPKTDETCIIVVETSAQGRSLRTGLIVDRVSEVLNIQSQNIEEAPSFGLSVESQFILGMGKVGSTVKILLDIDKVLRPSGEESTS